MRALGRSSLLIACVIAMLYGMHLAHPLGLSLIDQLRQEAFGLTDPFYAAFGGCGVPCEITHNSGGRVRVFAKAVEIAKQRRTPFVVQGRCISACGYALDLLREQACIMPSATFEFHKMYVQYRDGRAGYLDPPQSTDIAHWVHAHGGYQISTLLVMPFMEAVRFWKKCRTPRITQSPRPMSGRGVLFLVRSRYAESIRRAIWRRG